MLFIFLCVCMKLCENEFVGSWEGLNIGDKHYLTVEEWTLLSICFKFFLYSKFNHYNFEKIVVF
jgi:hypothetical protein